MRLSQQHLALLQRVFEDSDVERIELVAGSERLALTRAGVVGPTVVTAPGNRLRVEVEGARYFRWSDGDWIVAAEVVITAVEPTEVSASSFTLRGTTPFYPWSPVTTLAPGRLDAGATARGTVGFYTSGRHEPPTMVTLALGDGAWSADLQPLRGEDRGVTLAQVPGSLDPGSVQEAIEAAQRAGVLQVELRDATTFRWADDDWIVTVHATVSNRADSPVPVSRSIFQCSAGGFAMRPWAPASTFVESATLAPGERVEGLVGFYYHRSLPQPEHVVAVYGPTSQRATSEVLVARLDPGRQTSTART